MSQGLGSSSSDVPGFNADIVYTKHANRVKAVQPGPARSFISVDHSSLHIWARNHIDPNVIDVSCCMSFPPGKRHFIAAVCHAAPLAPSPIVLAACLDNTLKVYTDKLKLRSCIPWTCGTVTHLLYNHSNDTIITNGSAGVQLWLSRPDTEALASTAQLSGTGVPIFSTVQQMPTTADDWLNQQEQLCFCISGFPTLSSMVARDSYHRLSALETPACTFRSMLQKEHELFICLLCMY